MRIYATAAFALFAALAGAALADSAADGGWYLKGNVVLAGRPSPVSMGTGTTAGMTGDSAVYIRRILLDDDKDARYNRNQGLNPYATLEKKFPLQAWRGKRLRVTMRLKNDGAAIGQAMVRMEKNEENHTGMIAVAQRNKPGNTWQNQQVVLDVPDNAAFVAVDVRLRLAGTVWVDAIGLEEVGKEVPLTNTVRADYACEKWEFKCDPTEAGRRLYKSWQSALSF